MTEPDIIFFFFFLPAIFLVIYYVWLVVGAGRR